MPVAHESTVRKVTVNRLTIADAANLFLGQLHERAEARQVTWGHYRTTADRLRRITEAIGRTVRLADVTKETLQAAVLYFAKRPPAKPRFFQKKQPVKPIGLVTAKGCISMTKTLFVWLAEHDQLTWNRPRGFDRLFKLRDRRLRTPEEEAQEAERVVSGEVASFTTDELTRMFRAANSRERLYLLLGLNCGFTSGEVSSLRTFEVFLEVPEPYIHKRRAKTGVEAKWMLWPETSTLLRRHKAPANEKHLWLLTEAGNPLVDSDQMWRRDAIDKSWDSLRARSGMKRWLGYRFLRKTGASAVKRLGGLEESEMYLAHQELGLNKHYANRQWPKLWACLARYRSELPFLGPAWDLDPSECLFTQNGNPDWADANPPWVQHVTKRSELGLLNVSLHKEKRKYFGRIYKRGKNYFTKYFDTAEEARVAVKELRRRLDAGVDPKTGKPLEVAGPPPIGATEGA
jgi:hypothetical protein